MKKWLIFGLYGGLLNFILFLVVIVILIGGDTPGNLAFAVITTFLPGLAILVIGGLVSEKEYKYSTFWAVIFSLLTLILWGFSIAFIASYIL